MAVALAINTQTVGYIEKALRYADGTHTIGDVLLLIEDGHLQVWPGANSVVVTQIIKTPRKKTLHIFLAGGETGSMAEIEAGLGVIYEWAIMKGCDSASFTGRKGWERTFATKEHGWAPTHTMFNKDLT